MLLNLVIAGHGVLLSVLGQVKRAFRRVTTSPHHPQLANWRKLPYWISTTSKMPAEADPKQDKAANAAQARQVIDLFHEISTLLVRPPSCLTLFLPSPLLIDLKADLVV